MKTCTKCEQNKEFGEFYKDKSRKDGLCNCCKFCSKQKRLAYYQENKDKCNLYNKMWIKANPERAKEINEIFHINNPEYNSEYLQENKENINIKRNERSKKRRQKDNLYRLLHNIRSRISTAIRNTKLSKNKKTLKLLGCSVEFLKEYIENRFQPGMTWNNNNIHGWHIDHIIPLSSAKTEQDIYSLCHYTNLQPLWAVDNIRKSNKILMSNPQ